MPDSEAIIFTLTAEDDARDVSVVNVERRGCDVVGSVADTNAPSAAVGGVCWGGAVKLSAVLTDTSRGGCAAIPADDGA